MAHADEEPTHSVTLEMALKCPYSMELQNLIDSIPPIDRDSPEWEEWKQSFVNNMQRLIELVESDKVGNSYWTIHVSPAQDSPQ